MTEAIYEPIYVSDHVEGSKGNILLVDADSIKDFDNIAIGKLITHYESENYWVAVLKLKYSAYPNKRKKTIIDGSGYSAVRVSIIFKRNKDMVEITGCDDVVFGGTGYDLETELPFEIDTLEYTPYCNNDEKVEFITRGCNNNCWFCVVYKKEGPIHLYRSIERILDNYEGKTIRFLDNNFLMWDGAIETLKILVDNKVKCYFDQGMDIRLINDENAKLLSLLNYGSPEYVFAFDNINLESIIDEKLAILKKYITKDWKFKFYVFVHAEQPIHETVHRIKWCKSNKVLSYIMRFDDCYTSDNKDFYTDLAAWCNQPRIFKKMSFEQYINKRDIKRTRADKLLFIYNQPVNKSNQSTISEGPKGVITRTKKPVTISSDDKEEMQVTFDGYIRIKRIIKRTVGRGSDPDKIVWHKHKWTTITKKVSSHPRGKTRSIANEIFAMIREDYDNFDLPEPLLPPVIILPESEPVEVQKEKGSPCSPSKEKNELDTIEDQGGIPSVDRPPGITRPAKMGVPPVQDHGMPSLARKILPEPKIKSESKVNGINNLHNRIRKFRKELNGRKKFGF